MPTNVASAAAAATIEWRPVARGGETGRRKGLRFSVRETSWGWMAAGGDERGLAKLALPRPDQAEVRAEARRELGSDAVESDRAFAEVYGQLEEYFAGQRRAFDLTLAPTGTPFQLAVWERLVGIPCGETSTYGTVAAAIGRPNGPRAVGQAVGTNPLGIVVPCHRVLATQGGLGGFGGGLPLKLRLLELEGAALGERARRALR